MGVLQQGKGLEPLLIHVCAVVRASVGLLRASQGSCRRRRARPCRARPRSALQRLSEPRRSGADLLEMRSRQTVSRRPSQLAANTTTSLETLGTLDSSKKRRAVPRRREQECDLAGLPWLANGSWTKLALSPLLFTIAKQCLAPFILASVLGKMHKNFSPGQRMLAEKLENGAG